MLHFMLIAIFACVVMADQFRPSEGVVPSGDRQPLPFWSADGSAGVLAITWGIAIALVIAQLVAGRIARRRLEQTGEYSAVMRFDRVVLSARWLAVMSHATCVLALGSLAANRAIVGNVVVLDELLTSAPALLVIIAGWWASFPMDRLMREAVMVRSLDRSRPVFRGPTRIGHVLMQVRHQVLLVLVPMSALTAISELSPGVIAFASAKLEHAAGGVGAFGRWLATSDGQSLSHTVIQITGVVLLLALMPLGIRWLWDTVPIRSGTMAEDLLGLCHRNGVRARELLLWRTDGTMINGAVIGVFGRARHILLTDALLNDLPIDQVRAVLAHELGHIRHRHIIWLGLALISSVLVLTFLIGIAINLTLAALMVERLPAWVEYAGATGAILGAFVIFGWVSRKFEWQADAFAAVALSRDELAASDTMNASASLTNAGFNPVAQNSTIITSAMGQISLQLTPPGLPVVTPNAVTPNAVRAMAGALDSVAALNHIPRRRFAFRHGSIQTRIENLVALEGASLGALPIDRTARRIKLVTIVLTVLAAIALVLDTLAHAGAV
ncbi:MAG: M48 family metalloprotease [Phycisphaerales bacterium]|nr:M48 family metalloprotease [Phycisphaerales bacterium]